MNDRIIIALMPCMAILLFLFATSETLSMIELSVVKVIFIIAVLIIWKIYDKIMQENVIENVAIQRKTS